MGKPPKRRVEGSRRHTPSGSRPETAAAPDRPRKGRIAAWALIIGIGAMGVTTVAAGFLNADDSDDRSTQAPETSLPIEPGVAVTVPPAGETITGETPCPPEDASTARATSFENPPPQCIDPTGRYQAVLHTSEGDIELLLDHERAPATVNNFVVLALYHYFDGLPFFAIAPQTLIATGDALGEPEVGSGGPGYTFASEIPEVGVIYPSGTVAMWTDIPDENGSRFFIASGDGAAALPPDFTAFGLVTNGMDTVRAIEGFGNAFWDPTAEILVESVEIVRLPDPTTDTTEGADGGQ